MNNVGMSNGRLGRASMVRISLAGFLALVICAAGSSPAQADDTETGNLVRRAIDNTMSQGLYDVVTLTTCNARRCTFSPHTFTLTNGQVLRIHGTKSDAGEYTSYRLMPSGRMLAAVGNTLRTGYWATREELLPPLREAARAAGLPPTGSVTGLDEQEDFRWEEGAWPPLQAIPSTASWVTDVAANPSRLINLQATRRADGSTVVSWSFNSTGPFNATGLFPCPNGTSQVVISPAEVIRSSKTVWTCPPGTGAGSRTSESTANYRSVRIKGPVAPVMQLDDLG
jgi:hypothetical protein